VISFVDAAIAEPLKLFALAREAGRG